MKTTRTTVDTPRRPEEVYDYLADFENQVEWRFDVLRCELISGEPGAAGARYRQRVKQGGREMDSEVELTSPDRPRRLGFRTVDDGPLAASGTWELTLEGEGTRVVCDVALETRGFIRFFEPFMGISMRKTARRYEEDLRAKLA